MTYRRDSGGVAATLIGRTAKGAAVPMPALAPALAFGLGLVLSSCTSPGAGAREYAVPDSLCGVGIAPEVLAPALPAGKEISAHPRNGQDIGIVRCRLHVDGKSVFSASIERWEKDTSAADVAVTALNADPGGSQSTDHRFVYSTKGAVGRVVCPAPATGAIAGATVWASVRVTRDGVSSEQMKDLITAYTNAVSASGRCGEVLVKPGDPR
ncbi:hypothetical protein ABZ990_28165 [Streptomyces sp. NPDC046203]|uniref:hypothetical protein n=1 Tax=Streptomyces sp. NPDC046203 TaxID=3154602 RepID=UPI0033CC9F36